MKLAATFPFLVLTSILVSTTTHVQSIDLNMEFNPISLVPRPQSIDLNMEFNPIALPRPDRRILVWTFTSWRFAVETNNLRDWIVIPPECTSYVKEYMTPPSSLDASQYQLDLSQLSRAISDLFNSSEVGTIASNDVFIFDLSETLLSNLPYYQRPDVNYGSKPFDRPSFLEWVAQGEAPAVPFMTDIYNLLVRIGYKAVIISGSSESLRGVLEDNLKKVGYDNWFRFYLKDEATSTKEFKIKVRTQLVEEGYNIVGNIGDQWRDLTGAHAGGRTFKVPNPMYYLG